MALALNAFLDRWKHRFLTFAGDTEFRDHLLRGHVQYQDVTISAAEMDALNATPKTLLAAPGSGLVNVLVGVFCFNDFAATAFELGTGTLDLRYTDGSGTLAAQFTNAFVESAADAYAWAAPQAHVVAAANAPIVAKASADVTAGDGKLYLRLFYLTVKAAEIVD